MDRYMNEHSIDIMCQVNDTFIPEWNMIEIYIRSPQGSQKPWKVLEFDCCLEKCLISHPALKMKYFHGKVLEHD